MRLIIPFSPQLSDITETLSLTAPEDVCTHSSILLYAMLILRRRQQNPAVDEAISTVCSFLWVLKYICLIMLSSL